jgi:hypothetical protein
MSNQFVPLLQVASSRPGSESTQFRPQMMPVKVTPAAPPSTGQKTESPACSHSGDPADSSQPKISLQHEGDKLVGISITCGCGQVINLVCTY